MFHLLAVYIFVDGFFKQDFAGSRPECVEYGGMGSVGPACHDGGAPGGQIAVNHGMARQVCGGGIMCFRNELNPDLQVLGQSVY